MPAVTTHFYLFAKNPRLRDVRNRRILAGYPDEGEGVAFTTYNKPIILGVVNIVSQVGVPALFPVLPELIAPANGGAYNTLFPDHTHGLRALLIWEELDIRGRLAHKHATYAIHFMIDTEAPNCAIQLALLLTHLATDDGVVGATARVPKLADLVYSITPSGVFGTAYFNGLRRAYRAVKAAANVDSYFTRVLEGTELHLSTIPDGNRILAQPRAVSDCYATARGLDGV